MCTAVTPPACVCAACRASWRQVLNNLLGNAAKFTRQGTIRVSASWHDGQHQWVAVHVSDTGVGIPKHKLASIFLPFEQVRRGSNLQQQSATAACMMCSVIGRLGRPGGGCRACLLTDELLPASLHVRALRCAALGTAPGRLQLQLSHGRLRACLCCLCCRLTAASAASTAALAWG